MKNLQWIADHIDEYDTKRLCVSAYCLANDVKEATGLDHYREAVKKFELVTAYEKKKLERAKGLDADIVSPELLDNPNVHNIGGKGSIYEYFEEEMIPFLSVMERKTAESMILLIKYADMDVMGAEFPSGRRQASQTISDSYKALNLINENVKDRMSRLNSDSLDIERFDALASGSSDENVRIYREHRLLEIANG